VARAICYDTDKRRSISHPNKKLIHPHRNIHTIFPAIRALYEYVYVYVYVYVYMYVCVHVYVYAYAVYVRARVCVYVGGSRNISIDACMLVPQGPDGQDGYEAAAGLSSFAGSTKLPFNALASSPVSQVGVTLHYARYTYTLHHAMYAYRRGR